MRFKDDSYYVDSIRDFKTGKLTHYVKSKDGKIMQNFNKLQDAINYCKMLNYKG